MRLDLPLLPGVRLELRGACNRCGACCTRVLEGGQRVVCEYLRVASPPVPLGHPGASWCAVYEYRTPAQPLKVRMLDARGTAVLEGPCHQDTWQEDQAIAAHGIGRGCSLELVVHRGAFQPA